MKRLQILYVPENEQNLLEEVRFLQRTIADLSAQLATSKSRLYHSLKWIDVCLTNENIYDIDPAGLAHGADDGLPVAKAVFNGKKIFVRKNEIKDIRIVDGEKKLKTNFQIWNEIEKSKQEKEMQAQARREEYARACLDGEVIEYNINEK